MCLIASPDGDEGSLRVDQDVRIYASIVTSVPLSHRLAPHRRAYLHVVSATVDLNGHTLNAGDGAQIEECPSLHLRASDEAEILLFDLR